MDWGIELWDQFEGVDKHTQHSIEYAEKYAKFVKERCAIEMDYASKLRKLVKSYQPKKRDENRSMYSTHKAFQSQLSELNDIAGQHETVAEEMHSTISKAMLNFCNELKLEKKKIYQDGRHLQSVLDQHERALEQTKKKFEKEWKECERAQANFEKLDADGNVTKADVEKAKHAWQTKKDSVENCKTDYGAALQTFNKEQQDHYSTHMPQLFQLYKETDERRILKSRELMVEYARIDLAVKPIIQKCLDGMKDAANAIDAKLDAQLVVEKLKSGFVPPSDKEFEDYTQPNQRPHGEENTDSSQRNSLILNRNPNRKGLSWLFGGNKKHSKQPRKRLSSPIPEGKSSPDLENSEPNGSNSKAADQNGDSNCAISVEKQKSRTLSHSALKVNSASAHEKGLTAENRSSSANALNKVGGETKYVTRKSNKIKSKHHDFRVSLPVNKKRLMSMFRPSKDEHLPVVEVSGPITCDMMGSAGNDGYLVPISASSPSPPPPPPSRSVPSPLETENPYDEVAASTPNDDGTGAAESPDFSHLPPEQRKKKLQKIIDDLRKDINKEEDGRKAIVKMQDVYRSNPAMGDADSLAGQIKMSTSKIEKLQAELSQHESWYTDACGGVQSSSARSTLSKRTLPDKPKESSPTTIQPLATGSQSSNRYLQRDQSFGDDFDEEPEPIGTCVALYDFEATSDGALSMKAGDKFSVIEADNGDGWTRAMQNDIDGYVPTSYIEVNFYT